MSLPEIVSREKWTRARVVLLEREKTLTRARDELAAERRRLPMVEVTEDYRFTATDGSSRALLDLFEGRHQLIVDHYMFDPDWEDGCMSCAGRVDQYGNTAHLHERDTTIAVVSRVLELRQPVQLRLRRVVRQHRGRSPLQLPFRRRAERQVRLGRAPE